MTLMGWVISGIFTALALILIFLVIVDGASGMPKNKSKK